ncbi:hypothetical protein KY311_00130, partial [Candidatus Woesearchaeota archaeon]|nr:hypothetical protein [Candidatus Woesearchaeota archaeon]
ATFNFGAVIAIEYNTDQYPELSEFEKMLLEFEYKGQRLVERVEEVPITGVPEKPINNTSQTG